MNVRTPGSTLPADTAAAVTADGSSVEATSVAAPVEVADPVTESRVAQADGFLSTAMITGALSAKELSEARLVGVVYRDRGAAFLDKARETRATAIDAQLRSRLLTLADQPDNGDAVLARRGHLEARGRLARAVAVVKQALGLSADIYDL